MPTSEMMCFHASKDLDIMQFRSWLFKSIHIMLALGNSFEASHVLLSFLFVYCTAYLFIWVDSISLNLVFLVNWLLLITSEFFYRYTLKFSFMCCRYHVTNFFAPSSRCGTPDDLKSLIDKAHELGLLVLMDIVHR